AWAKIVFPAPVSPVTAFNPGAKASCPADEDEVVDPKAPEHGLDATPRARVGRSAQTAGSALALASLLMFTRAPLGWVGDWDGTAAPRTQMCRLCVNFAP